MKRTPHVARTVRRLVQRYARLILSNYLDAAGEQWFQLLASMKWSCGEGASGGIRRLVRWWDYLGMIMASREKEAGGANPGARTVKRRDRSGVDRGSGTA